MTTLSDASIQALRKVGAREHHPRDNMLFAEGDDSARVLLVEEGTVKITNSSPDGYVCLLAIRGPGELVGEFGAIDGRPRSATVTALTEVVCTTITADRFRQVLTNHPAVALELLQTVAGRVREADRRRLEFAAYRATERVTRILFDLASQHGRPVPGEVRAWAVPTFQHDIAAAAGTSVESVGRALRDLTRHRLIRTNRGEIVITDFELFSRLVHDRS